MISQMEIRRKTVHILSGIILVILLEYNIITKYFLLWLLAFALCFSIISLKLKVPLATWILHKFDRKDAAFPALGAITFLIGFVLVLYLFPRDIAYASMLIMAFGDGFATLIGKTGKIRTIFNKKKTLEGTVAGTIAAFVGASLIIPMQQAVFASAFAMFVELIGFKVGKIVDDNITVTLAAAVGIYFVRIVL
ncbi:hypothetical protein J4438_02100 [Candidatus Woesearchaeota archaeon]|nr:hypothetical protein [Candidatus Woesearchaeota archaeon]